MAAPNEPVLPKHPPVKCFLSHTWTDHGFAKYLYKRLTRFGGMQVWIDEREIAVGDSILARMAEGLQTSDAFIIVLSPDAIASENVQLELERALIMRRDDGKKILPVLIRDCTVPPFLTGTLYADFRDERRWEGALKELVRSIRTPSVRAVRRIKELFFLLTDGKYDQRQEALRTLAELRLPGIADSLVELLGNPGDAKMASDTLIARRHDVVRPLTAALSRDSVCMRRWAASTLRALNVPEALEGLVRCLHDEDSGVRERAAAGLFEMRDARSLIPFIGALNDTCKAVRCTAARALGEIGDLRAVQPLWQLLIDSEVGPDAARAIGRIGGAAVPLLIRALEHDNRVVRRHATQGLGAACEAHSEEARCGVPALIRALNDEEWTVRLYAASALGQLSERSAVVPLISALMDAERRVVIQAANALGRIGDPQAVGPVIGALSRSENSGDKEVLIDVLSGFRDVVAFDPLIRATQDYDRFVRKHAAMALGVLGDTRAVPALLPLLADEEPYVHEEAEEALRKLAPNLDDEGRAEVTEALQSRRRAW